LASSSVICAVQELTQYFCTLKNNKIDFVLLINIAKQPHKSWDKTNLGGFKPSRKSKNLPKTERNPGNRKNRRPISNAGRDSIILHAIGHMISYWYIQCRVNIVYQRAILSKRILIII
jgi:hypothetical protein